MAIYNLAGATLTNVFLSANSTVPTVFTGPLSANAGTSTHKLLGSVVEGDTSNVAAGLASHAEGINNTASGAYSHVEGSYTVAFGNYSHAEGINNVAYESSSHAEGVNNRVMGYYSHGEGIGSIVGEKVIFSSYTSSTRTFTFTQGASGKFNYLTPGMVIYGYEDNNLGDVFSAVVQSRSPVTGNIIITTDVIGADSTGNYNYILRSSIVGTGAHVEGDGNVATGYASHAEGINNIAQGNYSHAEGYGSVAGGIQSHAINYLAAAAGGNTFAGGYETVAANENSFTHGYRNHTGKRIDFQSYSNATRTVTFANNLSSNFAYVTPGTVIGFYDVGLDGIIIGIVESRNLVTGAITFTYDPWGGNLATPGYAVAAAGPGGNSFAIGIENQSYGESSFAGGGYNIASGAASFAFGDNCTAEGIVSMALGNFAQTNKDYSYIWNSSLNYVSATRVGQYMLSATSNVFSPGTVSIGSDRIDAKLNVTGNTIIGNTGCTAPGTFAIATGINSRSTANGTTTFGAGTSATGNYSIAMGVNNLVSGINSLVGGNLTRATANNTLAFGLETSATGVQAVSLGAYNLASGAGSTCIGDTLRATGDQSFATGFGNLATGAVSFVEGDSCRADGYCSHAAGFGAVAAQDYTYMWTDGNGGTLSYSISTTRANQFAVSASGGIFFPGNVGIGTDSIANKLTVSGTVSASTAVVAGAFVPGANFINTQSGTTYLLTNGDNGRAITLNNASPITVAIPANLPVGYNVMLVQIGTGQVSLSSGVGVTVNSDGGKTKIASQYSSASLLSYAANVFNFSGNITT